MTLSEMVNQERDRVKLENETIDRAVSFYQQELKNVGIISSPVVNSHYPNYSIRLPIGNDASIIISKKHIFTPYNSLNHNETNAALRDIARTIAERNIHAITLGPKKT